MPGNKYLANNAGHPQEVAAIQSSAGAGDAGKIPALDAGGHLDPSLMPSGVAADVVTCIASEALAAGAWINLYDNAGTLNARNADATTNGKRCMGFVLASVSSGASATVYLAGVNTGVTGQTIGATVFLATTPGAGTTAAPSASGNLVQQLGFAYAVAGVQFEPQEVATVA